MTSIKMLAALLALATTAAFGAASAMAEETALCKADQNPCEPENLPTHAHGETEAGHPAILLSGLGNILCTVLHLASVGKLGSPQVLTGHFTFSKCVRDKIFGTTEECSVKEVGESVTTTVLKTGHESAEVQEALEVEGKCGSVIQCGYDGEGLKGTATGPLLSLSTNGEVWITKQYMHRVSGSLCPEVAQLDIKIIPLAMGYIAG